MKDNEIEQMNDTNHYEVVRWEKAMKARDLKKRRRKLDIES